MLIPFSIFVVLLSGCTEGVEDSVLSSTDLIRLNQVGYHPDMPKMAAIVGQSAEAFVVVASTSGDTVFSGTVSGPQAWEYSGESVQLANFSSVTEQGMYRLVVSGVGESHEFEVGEGVYAEIARTTLKALYFQRNSSALPADFAGPWTRDMGHPDDSVLVHASAASASRPEGTVLVSPDGWYDAGDYNKYVVPAAVTSFFLFEAYEDAPGYFDTLETNIPETSNQVPDVLDEAIWNLRWMMSMQDPEDGGLYHKLTHASFSGVVMQDEADEPRYVVQKSTSAALTFAAAMAQANRTLKKFDHVFPGLADSCLTAAQVAWGWAQANPDVIYNQNLLNERFDPDLSTGAYGDVELGDEKYWAAAELARSTGERSYLEAAPAPENVPTPYWEFSVAMHGAISLAGSDLEGADEAFEIVKEEADRLLGLNETSAYAVPIDESGDFVWGGNGYIAAKAVVLLSAFERTGKQEYLEAASSVVDYLLGQNATGYSFVTGLGDRPPMFPHHRPSEADEVVDPVPGLLVGGPADVDAPDCESYPSDLPAKRYLDDWCSYSTNEITTYWNTPLTYAAAVLQSIHDASR